MDRVLFQRTKQGYRSVRGELVRRVQIALRDKGFSTGEIDGVFGIGTEAALYSWQKAAGTQPSGAVTASGWEQLLNAPIPCLRDRCLQITADFEGHGFSKVIGNFDGAWLTWGIIGFTLRGGELVRVLNDVRLKCPLQLAEAFGPLARELSLVLDRDARTREEWANAIAVGEGRYRLLPEWTAAFEKLGSFPEVQEIQIAAAGRFWVRAQLDAQALDLKTERGLALCFDIAVQNGGVSRPAKERIKRRLERGDCHRECDRLLIIADVVAELSVPPYVEDVRSRKRTLAAGEGTVHGIRYETRTWGVDEIAA